MGISEKTKCWLCGRTAKEVLEKVLEMFGSGDDPFRDKGYECCVREIELYYTKIFLCEVCYNLIRQISEDEIKYQIEEERISVEIEPNVDLKFEGRLVMEE
ncbi:hypothetical protein DRO69_00410 [Candidatus Bathyarchaeota archaeon]|nr:MAG: hypothetical protein DRO69_00410 [Candidatus Bathyarchaeota archaeon]